MSRKFPHLNGSTNFPNDSIKPYEQYVNDVDYDSYETTYRMKPCNVKWTADSGDRVKWDSDDQRNAWFDQLDGSSFEFDSEFDVLPESTVRLPIPLSAAQWINYLMVETNVLPNETQPFDHQERTTKRYFYFVIAMNRASTSTTEFILMLDYWTTFINSVSIPRIELDRGHAAMQNTTVEKYLADPINNTIGLLGHENDAPESPVRISNSEFVPFDTGDLYFVFAMRCEWIQFTNLQKAGAMKSTTTPSFSNNGERWGLNYDVSGYEWGYVADLNNVTTPAKTGNTNDLIRPNGFCMIATRINDSYNKLFNMIRDNYPQMFNLMESCFVVGSSMLTMGETIDYEGITFQNVKENDNAVLKNIKLDKSMFDYPMQYAKLTKLYTFPYACLELSDNDGHESIIRIEDTTDATRIERKTSNLYPYLDCRAFLTGLGSRNHNTYEWRDMVNVKHTTDIPYSGFTTALAQYKIPTYTLFIDNTTAWNLDNAGTMIEQARENALNAYHISTRNNNTSWANSVDSTNTSQTNNSATNSTMLANANATNGNNTTIQNLLNLMNTTLANRQNSMNSTAASIKLTQSRSATSVQNALQQAVFEANQNTGAISTLVDGAGAVLAAGIAVAGVAAAPVTGGASLGATAAITTAGTSLTLATSSANLGVTMSNNSTVNDAQLAANGANLMTTENSVNSQLTNANNFTTDTTNTRNQVNSQVTAANNATTSANANRNASNSNTNMSRTANTSNNNSNETRDSGYFSAQTQLRQTQDIYSAQLRDLNRKRSTQITTTNGDPLPDIYGYRGYQIRVKTQTPDIVKRYGDDFLLHGYTVSENIEDPQLNQMLNFTYWRGDAKCYGDRVPAAAIGSIRQLFNDGVTVWRDADKIGSSIYEN